MNYIIIIFAALVIVQFYSRLYSYNLNPLQPNIKPRHLIQGCHGQRKVREKRKFFKVREKSGNFLKSQGKSLILSKLVGSQGNWFFGL